MGNENLRGNWKLHTNIPLYLSKDYSRTIIIIIGITLISKCFLRFRYFEEKLAKTSFRTSYLIFILVGG